MLDPKDAGSTVMRTVALARLGRFDDARHTFEKGPSRPGTEWAEALLKRNFLFHYQPEFSLIETMRFEPGPGIILLEKRGGRSGHWRRRSTRRRD